MAIYFTVYESSQGCTCCSMCSWDWGEAIVCNILCGQSSPCVFLRLLAQALLQVRRCKVVGMPQFTVEVSWLDLFKLCLWWLTMAMSFHMGRSRGFPKVPAGPAESKVGLAPQVPEVKVKFPQVFMAKKCGKVLHTEDSCTYLIEREHLAMNWCTRCTSCSAKCSKIA